MPAAIGALSRGYTGQMKAATVVILAVLRLVEVDAE